MVLAGSGVLATFPRWPATVGRRARALGAGRKSGAVDFLAKPFRDQDILDAVELALARDRKRRAESANISGLRKSYGELTPREREVMALVVTGLMNKQVAGELGASEITMKLHRSSLMRKMRATSLAELVKMAEALDRDAGRAE